MIILNMQIHSMSYHEFLVELNEINEAKLLISKMIKEYPEHTLSNKANQLLEDL